ncbi:MAG: c-type cytochrome [Candidatus Poribacteria bacterium]
MSAETSDKGARNLLLVFLGVWGGLTLFYLFLTWRAFSWDPMFFIKNDDSERSSVSLADLESEESETTAPFKSAIERGRRLYMHTGCILCHGVDGSGGVRSENYAKDTIPNLDNMVDKLSIWEPEDAEKVIGLLATNQSLDQIEELDLPDAMIIVPKYTVTRDVIEKGGKPGKKDPQGPPPLNMRSWKDVLTRRDVNEILAYLLSLYQWEGEE